MIDYIGSKYTLSDEIICEIRHRVPNLRNKIFAELFAGTGIISRKIQSSVDFVIANDVEYYSYVMASNYIGNYFEQDESISGIINMLNALPGVEGKIYKNYCIGSGSERRYFSDKNGKKIDAVRLEIESLMYKGEIDIFVRDLLLTSLLEAADKVSNTASVYGAFLKHTKDSAKKDLVLEMPVFMSQKRGRAFNQDANDLIKMIHGDVLYLDPPYNHRQYGANYHMLNTIAKYDDFEPKGKTGLREYYKSNYCKNNKALGAFSELIKHADFEYIFMSYNNEGIISLDEVKAVMSYYGDYELVEFEKYKRFKADTREYKAETTTEYLHILKKVS